MFRSIHIVLLAAVLAFVTSTASADWETDGNAAKAPRPGKTSEFVQNTPGVKLGSAFANIILSPLELPKTVINTSNDINMAAGVTLGVAKGLINMCGRAMAGIIDLFTFPVQTVPIAAPEFVWEKFNVETRFNPMFQMQK